MQDPDRLASLAAGFERRSYGKIRGCIGAVDGLLLPIESPQNEGGEGPRKYFTRKGFYAWNVQAVCDAHARITYFSMDYAGSTHDSLAFSMCDVAQTKILMRGDVYSMLVSNGYHLVGDEAYTAGHTLSTPWTGRACHGIPSRLAYNYYHSAARITIERAFGQLTKRYLILKRPFQGSVVCGHHAPGLLRVLRVCVKLVRATAP